MISRTRRTGGFVLQRNAMTSLQVAVQQIPVASIVAGDNDRKSFDPERLQELADDIAQQGLLSPIRVRPIPDGRLELVFGERRLRAVKLLGWSEIPGSIVDMDAETASAEMLSENLHRQALNPIDEARAYKVRMDRFGWDVSTCGEKARVSKDRVKQRLDLLRLGEDIQHLIRSGNVSLNYALAMVGLDRNRQQVALGFLVAPSRPDIDKFRSICGQMLLDQSQDKLFDDFELRVQNVEESEKAPSIRIPVDTSLPPMRGGGTAAGSITQYIADLTASPDPKHKEAAKVVGTVLAGLMGCNCARPTDEDIRKLLQASGLQSS
jgi:ParB/RepB/Spo0J family partition protein